ncbi:5-formyltetrahydrofolate cyclo-ligase [Corynebacterium tapiri]|nr:5-formyltetrahydrofolate cyclo-ligase [Corynebacterium tapiri]
MNKGDVRRAVHQRRRSMDPARRNEASQRITEEITTLLSAEAATRVAAYAPVGTEPGAGVLLEGLRDSGVEILLPVSLPHGRLVWGFDHGPESLTTSAYGLLEPRQPHQGTEVLTTCDFVFTPASALSPEGVRLGKGGGYYDRTLAQLSSLVDARGNHPVIVAVVYAAEIVAEVPVEKHDLPVDAVVTEQGVRYFNRRVGNR